ncbi:MAG TPA: hypothetical protein VGR47_02745 [Terracidiphilus sp.]|nr:hypothetical protein [Terracidiphilus sp.]HEV2396101.1 hypothetical protein [Candidatus Sulfotelmatobacter sp.]
MSPKSRFDFENHGDWLSYVATEDPVGDRHYTRASTRTELFRRLYQLLGAPLPAQFQGEFERITLFPEPERTAALEALNEAIFGHLTAQMINRAQQGSARKESEEVTSPQEQIQELREHLAHNNPYFALRIAYKEGVDDHRITENWGEYLARKLGPRNTKGIAFTRAMAELDALLHHFHDKCLRLPNLCCERIWFLHLLGEPERMAQTRAVLGALTAELSACTSA